MAIEAIPFKKFIYIHDFNSLNSLWRSASPNSFDGLVAGATDEGICGAVDN